MASTTANQTYRLFKVAAELNIGKETVAEFLKTKGFEIAVKPTSALTQEMYDLVMGKFEKEHKQIEKQRKKVDAYHERRGKKEDGDQPAESPAAKKAEAPAEPAPVVAETPVAAPEVEVPVAEIPAPEVPAEIPAPAPVEVPEPTPAPIEVVAEVPPPPAETAEAQEEKRQKVVAKKVADDGAAIAAAAPQPVVVEPVAVAQEPEAPAPVVAPVEIPAEAPAPTPVIAEEKHIAPEQPAETPIVEKPIEAVVPEAAPTPVEAPAPQQPPAPEEKLTFAAQQPKLQGLTVLGKIEIAKPVSAADKKSRMRKRIREAGKSVDINKEASSRNPVGPRPPNTDRPQTGGFGAGRGPLDKSGKKKPGARGVGGPGGPVDQSQVSKAIRQTFSNMGDSSKSARQNRSRTRRGEREDRESRRQEELDQQATNLQVTEFLTVADLANLMNVDVGQVIAKCIGLGLMVSINQRLEKDTIQLVADEFGYTVEFQQDYAEDALADIEDDPETLIQRAPIVTIMGHVDHGKTSLLDYIRSANVVAGESGGITQHIGAYSVQIRDGRRITFLDTPGHEAFTAMRARGAQATDIVVLVVAADDSVMPQTVEAISHAQAAGVPMVVAINKIDRPEANVERIKQQLSDRGVQVEEWGGKYQSVEISAKKGTGVDKLLDTILLEAEILDLKANPNRNARGVVIEAEIDRGKGIIATVLVQKGTLKVGDNFVAGSFAGRVRALLDERGHRITKAGPSEPAQILGFSGVPTAGDVMVCLDNEQDAREIALRRHQLRREQEFKQTRHLTLDEISEQISRGGVQHLPLIIKGDVDGSVEALADSLLRLSTPEVQVSVVLKSVGEISESDVLLAAASQAIIIGFHVRPNLKARKLAEREGVEIRTYQIIYDTVNEIRAALEGMLRPEQKEVVTGTVEVRDIFKNSKIGVIAGCYVLDGKITRNDKIRLLRDGLEIYTGGIGSLRRVKDDVREVDSGFECGITLDNMNDVKVGDVIEAFKMVEIKRKLEAASAY